MSSLCIIHVFITQTIDLFLNHLLPGHPLSTLRTTALTARLPLNMLNFSSTFWANAISAWSGGKRSSHSSASTPAALRGTCSITSWHNKISLVNSFPIRRDVCSAACVFCSILAFERLLSPTFFE